MLKVGLTGNIGSGKSTVSKIFNALEVPVFIADVEAKKLYNEKDVQDEIRDILGKEVFNLSGKIDHKLLAEIIFNNKNALLAVNRIIHPRTLLKYKQWLVKYKNYTYTIHESAILFENKLESHFDKIIHVSAPLEIRLNRVIRRNKTREEKVIERMHNQMADEEKKKLADFVLINDGIQMVIPQVMKLHQQLNNK